MEFQGAKYKIPKSLSRVNDCPVAILESVNSVAAMMSFIHAPLLSPKVAIPPASLGHRYMTSAHPGLSALVLSACHTFFKPVLVSQNLRPIKCPLFQKHQLFWGHPPSQTGEWTSFRDCPPLAASATLSPAAACFFAYLQLPSPLSTISSLPLSSPSILVGRCWEIMKRFG